MTRYILERGKQYHPIWYRGPGLLTIGQARIATIQAIYTDDDRFALFGEIDNKVRDDIMVEARNKELFGYVIFKIPSNRGKITHIIVTKENLRVT